MEAEVRAADEAFQADRARLDERFAERTAVISRAHASGKRQLAAEVEQLRQRTITEMQMRALRAKGGGRESMSMAKAEAKEFDEEADGLERDLRTLWRSARGDLRGYFFAWWRLLPKRGETMDIGEFDQSQDAGDLLANSRMEIEEARKLAGKFRTFGVPRLFKFLPPCVLLLLAVGGAWAWVHFSLGYGSGSYLRAGGVLAGFGGLLWLVHFMGGKGALPVARDLAVSLERARRLLDASRRQERRTFEDQRKTIKESVAEVVSATDARWTVAEELVGRRKRDGEQKIEAQVNRVTATNESRYQENRARLKPLFDQTVAKLRKASTVRTGELQAAHDEAQGTIDSDRVAMREKMEADWRATIEPICDEADARREAAGRIAPAWQHAYAEDWKPETGILEAVRFATLDVDGEGLAVDAGLTLEVPGDLSVPLTLHVPDEASLLVETDGAGRDEVIEMMNTIILRLLATSPPGKLNFTIIDPVGLGENFAGVMHLADYEDS